MTNTPGQDKTQEVQEITDKVIDRSKFRHLIDTNAMRFLEAMDFQSYNNLSAQYEQFMMAAPLFQGDVSFSRAAASLDLTARLFSVIDIDKNRLLNREEFAYMLLRTTEANRQALAWLIENFEAFTQACFFRDQISREDIEAARNVFHGLKVCQENFGFNKAPTVENLKELKPNEIQDYLDKNRDTLSADEASGLTYLLDHIKTNGETVEKTEPTGDRATKESKDDHLKALDGVLDKNSLKTLQTLKLSNFESLFAAFMAFVEDPNSFQGKKPFEKASWALDTTADALSELEMGEEHAFTHAELVIVSKLTKKEKKPIIWFSRYFDALANIFFKSGKTRRKDILAARNVFTGLSVMDEKFNFVEELETTPREELDQRIKLYLRAKHNTLEPQKKAGLEQLVEFMERHANG